jgi:hypothetical protein
MGYESGNGAADGGLSQIIEAVRLVHVPDLRSGVFDIRAEQRTDGIVLCGEATHDGAVADLLVRLREGGIAAADEVVRLPDASLGPARHALVRSALAPVYAFPRLPGIQISQLVLGMRVELLSRDGDWLRVRGEDGYIGWVHSGYVAGGA